MKWLPWKYIVKRVARAHGFIDPISVLYHLQRFAQPSEVGEPLELLRAGVVFHARGLMNTRAIQHNLDWVWPYWVERQFDPTDESFIPRAFSITHVNLSHRNWTGLGLAEHSEYAIVDPRGLTTPHFDGWSIDVWMVSQEEPHLFPSKLRDGVQQFLKLDSIEGNKPPYSIVTNIQRGDCKLELHAQTRFSQNGPTIDLGVSSQSGKPAELAICVRPYNPEGVSFIHSLRLSPTDDRHLTINDTDSIELHTPPQRWVFSNYRRGDATQFLFDGQSEKEINCPVGMATACALYPMEVGVSTEVRVAIPLVPGATEKKSTPDHRNPSLPEKQLPELSIPDKHFEFLFSAALRTLVLLCPDNGDVVPGPYTYKRFWYRDAVFMLHALLCCGFVEKVKNAVEKFPNRQTRGGYFLSQEGEWDSNGQVLWLMKRLKELSDWNLPEHSALSAVRGADWIREKRLSATEQAGLRGLLPAGFSAEHLGTNDYYYWDNYWAIAGLEAANSCIPSDHKPKGQYARIANEYRAVVAESIASYQSTRRFPGIPAAPFRRMDAGAIGSIVASYPLQLLDAKDQQILDTVNFLLEYCFLEDGFFQDMIHSGINAYLTLHVAQVLLRAGDERFFPLIKNTASLASPTGQWPEAIHPRTYGGCMGDGHHGWAAAEWVMMIRNMFVREEQNTLVLCSGLPNEWLESDGRMSFGPTWTRFGIVSVTITRMNSKVEVQWKIDQERPFEQIQILLPGCPAKTVEATERKVILERENGK